MSRVILGPVLNDIRGKIGAEVYGIWRGLHWKRRKPAVINDPDSENQKIVRDAFKAASQAWFALLPNGWREEWDEYAQTLGTAAKSNSAQGYKDIMPISRKVMSGYNSFIGVNVLAAKVGYAPISRAPLGEDDPGQPLNLSVQFIAGEPETFRIKWNDPPNLPVTGKILIWVKTSKLAHPQQVTSVNQGVETVDINNVKGAGGNDLGLPIDFYFFQVCAFDNRGIRTPGSNIVTYNKVV